MDEVRGMYEDEEYDMRRDAASWRGDSGPMDLESARLTGSTARLPTVRSRGTLRRDDADVTRPQAERRRGTRRSSSSHSSAQGRGARSDKQRRSRLRKSQRTSNGVSFVVLIVAMLLSALLGAGIATLVLNGQVSQAKEDAASAQSQASALSQQLSQLQTSEATSTSENTKSDDKNGSTVSSASTDGVEDPWLSSGELYTTGDSVLDQEVKAFCDSKCDTSMDLATASYNVYTGIAWSEYVERDEAQHPSGANWRTEYARMYYEHDCSGNCYEFAAFLSFCLQYLGYSDAHAEGVLVELQSGGWGEHGVVYVTSAEGAECYCDTSRGTDGWMLPVGTYNLKLQDLETA